MRATDQWYSYIAVSKKVHCGPVGNGTDHTSRHATQPTARRWTGDLNMNEQNSLTSYRFRRKQADSDTTLEANNDVFVGPIGRFNTRRTHLRHLVQNSDSWLLQRSIYTPGFHPATSKQRNARVLRKRRKKSTQASTQKTQESVRKRRKRPVEY